MALSKYLPAPVTVSRLPRLILLAGGFLCLAVLRRRPAGSRFGRTEPLPCRATASRTRHGFSRDRAAHSHVDHARLEAAPIRRLRPISTWRDIGDRARPELSKTSEARP